MNACVEENFRNYLAHNTINSEYVRRTGHVGDKIIKKGLILNGLW